MKETLQKYLKNAHHGFKKSTRRPCWTWRGPVNTEASYWLVIFLSLHPHTWSARAFSGCVISHPSLEAVQGSVLCVCPGPAEFSCDGGWETGAAVTWSLGIQEVPSAAGRAALGTGTSAESVARAVGRLAGLRPRHAHRGLLRAPDGVP